MADQLCTTAQVKARIGDTDAVDDTLISEIVDEVSAFIQGYCGRKFVPVASADYLFDTLAGYVLRVPMGIRAVTFLGVASTNQPDSAGTYTTVPATDYLLRPKAQDLDGWPFTEIRIKRGGGTAVPYFYSADNGVKLTATTGFATTPLDIASVAIDGSVAAYQSRMNGASSVIGADDIAIPPWRSFFSRGSPQMRILDRYRYFGLA